MTKYYVVLPCKARKRNMIRLMGRKGTKKNKLDETGIILLGLSPEVWLTTLGHRALESIIWLSGVHRKVKNKKNVPEDYSCATIGPIMIAAVVFHYIDSAANAHHHHISQKKGGKIVHARSRSFFSRSGSRHLSIIFFWTQNFEAVFVVWNVYGV